MKKYLSLTILSSLIALFFVPNHHHRSKLFWHSLSTLCRRTHVVTTSPQTAGKLLSKILHQSEEVEDLWDRNNRWVDSWIILTKRLACDSYSILSGETEGVSENFFDCCNDTLKYINLLLFIPTSYQLSFCCNLIQK